MPDNKSDRHTHKVQHLLCEEGRRALEETLKLSGWWIDVLCPTDEEMKTLSKVLDEKTLTHRLISLTMFSRHFISTLLHLKMCWHKNLARNWNSIQTILLFVSAALKSKFILATCDLSTFIFLSSRTDCSP